MTDPEKAASLVLRAGWGFPGSARKAHWFDENELISVCGRWMYSGSREGTADAHSPDDCVACTRLLSKRGQGNTDSPVPQGGDHG